MPLPKRIFSFGFSAAMASLLCLGCVPRSRLDHANAELAAAQVKIKSLEHDLATTRAALDQARADAAKTAPATTSAHALPIKTRLFRRGREFLLIVKNESPSPLRLAVTVSAVGRWITAAPIIDPSGDWRLPQLLPGDTVELTSDGYDPQKISVQ